MIIIMQISSLNEAAAKKLAAEENDSYIDYGLPIKEKGTVDNSMIILLDLSEDALQTSPSIPSIAYYLSQNNLLKNGTSIKILFHDVNNTLPQFRAELEEEVRVEYQTQVTVSTLTNSAYEYTIIKQNGNAWEIYGVFEKDMPAENRENFVNKLENISNKTLLWSGDCIKNYSTDFSHRFT